MQLYKPVNERERERERRTESEAISLFALSSKNLQATHTGHFFAETPMIFFLNLVLSPFTALNLKTV